MNVSKEIKELSFLQVASELAHQLEDEVYIGGGFVRDLILRRVGKDIDFLVIGDVMNYAQSFANKLRIKDIVVYRTFGTAHFIYNGLNFEFVAARPQETLSMQKGFLQY